MDIVVVADNDDVNVVTVVVDVVATAIALIIVDDIR
jgi:hypothetical protein